MPGGGSDTGTPIGPTPFPVGRYFGRLFGLGSNNKPVYAVSCRAIPQTGRYFGRLFGLGSNNKPIYSISHCGANADKPRNFGRLYGVSPINGKPIYAIACCSTSLTCCPDPMPTVLNLDPDEDYQSGCVDYPGPQPTSSIPTVTLTYATSSPYSELGSWTYTGPGWYGRFDSTFNCTGKLVPDSCCNVAPTRPCGSPCPSGSITFPPACPPDPSLDQCVFCETRIWQLYCASTTTGVGWKFYEYYFLKAGHSSCTDTLIQTTETFNVGTVTCSPVLITGTNNGTPFNSITISEP